MNETIHIVIPSSDWYMPYTLVLITSIIANKKQDDDIFIHIITEDVSEKYFDYLNEIKNIGKFRYEIKKVNKDLIKDIPASILDRCPTICNYKLFIASLFNFNKVIVLEGDMVVLKSLSDLYKTSMDDCPMGAVKDPVCNECQDTLEIPHQYRYCNTGMFLGNLAYWRKYNSQEEFIRNAKKFKNKMLFPDQDIFNITFYKKMKYLPLQYNVYASIREDNFPEERIESYKDPIIIHWADYRKPWEYPEIRSADVFWKYARLSPSYEILLSRIWKRCLDDTIDSRMKVYLINTLHERKKLLHKLFLRKIRYWLFHRKKDREAIKEIKAKLRGKNV